jgi:uncharacterized repeat protein (TIGR03803 family)
MAQTPTVETIYNFTHQSGGAPAAGVTIGSGGELYGTTDGSGIGTVFSLTPPSAPGGLWTEHILHEFSNSPDGFLPQAGVTVGPGGIVYGTTFYGGDTLCAQDLGCGTVFSVTPPAAPGDPWTEAVIHAFNDEDGSGPASNLAVRKDGVLYGTTSRGGSIFEENCGTVFSLAPPAVAGGAWTERVLHMFAGPADGCNPNGVAIGAGGVLYGTTSQQGPGELGTVFALAPPTTAGGAWTETILYSFAYDSQGGKSDGANPSSAVTIGGNGALYGTTGTGGTGAVCACGTVYSLTPPAAAGGAWTKTILYSFGATATDPSFPQGVTFGSGGRVLYGTTLDSGGGCCGVLYLLSPPPVSGGNWMETILYSSTTPGGVNAGLAVGKNGVVYGSAGGLDESGGTVFAYLP